MDENIIKKVSKEGVKEMDERLTITYVAKELGVTPRTIMRWEKAGKIRKPKRDRRGWRFYTKEMMMEIKEFYESSYDYDQFDRSIVQTAKDLVILLIAISCLLAPTVLSVPAYAESTELASAQGIRETSKSVDIVLDELPAVESTDIPHFEAVKYTLGPNDVISVEVRRHPEFSGEYRVNSEGKIEYKYIGDILISGLTKTEVNKQLNEILSDYLVNPEVDVQIVAYLSKVFYVVGEVGRPGKFYMRGDTISAREALVQAGLPTHAAAMRRCRLISPNEEGNLKYTDVNVYELLYAGDLRENRTMEPGDVLYVPATFMAKVIRVISPITGALGQATGAATSTAAAAAL
ncbi:MAG: polysaccharide biosynthesis/export family protein [Candidatus Omnitrophota bacterium]